MRIPRAGMTRSATSPVLNRRPSAGLRCSSTRGSAEIDGLERGPRSGVDEGARSRRQGFYRPPKAHEDLELPDGPGVLGGSKRITEGMSKTEAIRCLKRYIARELYAQLTREALA